MGSIPQSGIYKITCNIDGRFYIGSSFNIEVRWDKHRRQLRIGKHHNIHLQRAWDKYGESAFVFEVLERVASWVLILREQYWLDKLQPFGKKGFNCSKIAGSPMKGRKHTVETKAKIGAFSKGKKASAETRIKLSVAQKGHPADLATIEKMAALKRGQKLKPEQIAKMTVISAKEYILTDPNGVEIRVKDLQRFCHEHDLNVWGMYHIVGKTKTYKKWKCRRA